MSFAKLWVDVMLDLIWGHVPNVACTHTRPFTPLRLLSSFESMRSWVWFEEVFAEKTMKSGMKSFGMALVSLSAIVNVLPVPVGPMQRTWVSEIIDDRGENIVVLIVIDYPLPAGPMQTTWKRMTHETIWALNIFPTLATVSYLHKSIPVNRLRKCL